LFFVFLSLSFSISQNQFSFSPSHFSFFITWFQYIPDVSSKYEPGPKFFKIQGLELKSHYCQNKTQHKNDLRLKHGPVKIFVILFIS
jgi:hypothetical protein